MCQDVEMTWNRKASLHRWLTWGGLVTLALVSAAAAWFAYSTVYTAAASTNDPSSQGAPGAVNTQQTSAVFIGDQFSTQRSVQLGGSLWTSEIARANSWVEKNWSTSGMGFVHRPAGAACNASECGNVLDQVPRVVAENPKVVFVSTGDADIKEEPEKVKASIASTFDALKIGLPQTQIVAIGPASVSQAPKPELVAIDGFVRTAAKNSGATYISLLNPKALDESMVSSNGQILNPSGQKALVTRISESLNLK